MKSRLDLYLLNRAEHDIEVRDAVVTLPNDADPFAHADSILAAQRVELDFRQFTDGHAFSQAYLIRRRLGFKAICVFAATCCRIRCSRSCAQVFRVPCCKTALRSTRRAHN